MAVVEDILICGVQTGLDTILYHLAGSWRALQFLHLSINKRNMGPWSCSPEWDLLLEFPLNYSRSHHLLMSPWALPEDEIARISDWENRPAHPFWSTVFSDVTQGTGVWQCGLRGDEYYSLRLCPVILILHVPVARCPVHHHLALFMSYLHSEESNAGQQIHCWLQVLKPLRASSREIILLQI